MYVVISYERYYNGSSSQVKWNHNDASHSWWECCVCCLQMYLSTHQILPFVSQRALVINLDFLLPLPDNGLKTRLEMIKNHAITVLQELKVILPRARWTNPVQYLPTQAGKMRLSCTIGTERFLIFLYPYEGESNFGFKMLVNLYFWIIFRARPTRLTKTWMTGWEKGFYRKSKGDNRMLTFISVSLDLEINAVK